VGQLKSTFPTLPHLLKSSLPPNEHPVPYLLGKSSPDSFTDCSFKLEQLRF
jgi:hypothetical protein